MSTCLRVYVFYFWWCTRIYFNRPFLKFYCASKLGCFSVQFHLSNFNPAVLNTDTVVVGFITYPTKPTNANNTKKCDRKSTNIFILIILIPLIGLSYSKLFSLCSARHALPLGIRYGNQQQERKK